MIIDINLQSDKVNINVYLYNDILFNCIKVDSIKTGNPRGVMLTGFKLYYTALTLTVKCHGDGI